MFIDAPIRVAYSAAHSLSLGGAAMEASLRNGSYRSSCFQLSQQHSKADNMEHQNMYAMKKLLLTLVQVVVNENFVRDTASQEVVKETDTYRTTTKSREGTIDIK